MVAVTFGVFLVLTDTQARIYDAGYFPPDKCYRVGPLHPICEEATQCKKVYGVRFLFWVCSAIYTSPNALAKHQRFAGVAPLKITVDYQQQFLKLLYAELQWILKM